MQQLIRFLNKISNWKSFLFFLALFLVFNGIILKNTEEKLVALAGKPVKIIDLTFGFNPQKTLNLVESYGNAARAYYAKVEMSTDLVYPLVYAFLFGILLTIWYRNSRFPWVSIIPFIVLLFDYAENSCIITLLKFYPEQSIVAATLCEIFKLLKWLSFGLILVMVFYGLMTRVFNKKTMQKN